MDTVGNYGYNQSSSANYFGPVAGSNLSENSKQDMLIKLVGRSKTVRQGGMFMIQHQALFPDFNEALRALRYKVNNPDNLSAVETELQKQIDKILEMPAQKISHEKKSLCLYALQNMIFGLSDLTFENRYKNNYVPQISQDLEQMKLKGFNQGMNWDLLNNSVHSHEFQDKSNPELANWTFLDHRKINQNLNVIYYKNNSEHYDHKEYAQFFYEPTYSQNSTVQKDSNNAVVDKMVVNNIDDFFQDASHKQILNTIKKLFTLCDKKDLYSVINENNMMPGDKRAQDPDKYVSTEWTLGIKNLFNFVKYSLTADNPNKVNYSQIHQVVNLFLRYAVEVGNKLKTQSMEQQINEKGEERSL